MLLRIFLMFAVGGAVCCAATRTEPIDIGSRLELLGTLGLDVASQPVALQSIRTRPIVGVHERLHSAKDAGMLPRKTVAMSGEISQQLDFGGWGITGGQPTGSQQLSDIKSVFAVGLESSACQRASLRGVGQDQLVDDRIECFLEPAIKADRFDSDGVGMRQRGEVFDDLLPTLAGDLAVRNFADAGDGARSNRGTAQPPSTGDGEELGIVVEPDAGKMMLIAVTNPIFVDIDGDRFTSNQGF